MIIALILLIILAILGVGGILVKAEMIQRSLEDLSEVPTDCPCKYCTPEAKRARLDWGDENDEQSQ